MSEPLRFTPAGWTVEAYLKLNREPEAADWEALDSEGLKQLGKVAWELGVAAPLGLQRGINPPGFGTSIAPDEWTVTYRGTLVAPLRAES